MGARAGRIVEVFKGLDANGDGRMSKRELQDAFVQVGLNDEALLRRTFHALDLDGDGILSFSEFTAGVLVVFRDLLEERLWTLFRRYDDDGDGMLDREEAQALL